LVLSDRPNCLYRCWSDHRTKLAHALTIKMGVMKAATLAHPNIVTTVRQH
jgi:hypothetical protein